jgi:hypothetical protein
LILSTLCIVVSNFGLQGLEASWHNSIVATSVLGLTIDLCGGSNESDSGAVSGIYILVTIMFIMIAGNDA